ncbi:MAG: hypothetical protein RR657_06400, partial [Peptostreptococcaceae bacterium]
DLYEVISPTMDLLANESGSSKNGVDYLQDSKLYNMVKLCDKLSSQEYNDIYNHKRFKCLRELVDKCN